MRVVGSCSDWQQGEVHTIDIWFSRRRDCWLVERLDVDGHGVGLAHSCGSMEDAEHCAAEWVRAHATVHLLAPTETVATDAPPPVALARPTRCAPVPDDHSAAGAEDSPVLRRRTAA